RRMQVGELGLKSERAFRGNRLLREIVAADRDRARVGMPDPGEQPHQSRLARAVAAEERDDAAGDGERDVVDDAPAAEGCRDVLDVDHAVHSAVRSVPTASRHASGTSATITISAILASSAESSAAAALAPKTAFSAGTARSERCS